MSSYKRIRLAIGDIFEVKLNNNLKGYFQYIGRDTTQLNSEVIRVFRTKYESSDEVVLDELVTDLVDFYTHTDLIFGAKKGLWEKIGNCQIEDNFETPWFRDSHDYGESEIRISNRWYVWKMNEKWIEVGKLPEEFKHLDIGVVKNVYDVVHKMIHGEYKFIYPGY